jgi:aryl-alcohol dehydrogenase-like predicted oxidoreductase
MTTLLRKDMVSVASRTGILTEGGQMISQPNDFCQRVPLGRTGLLVSRIGLGSSYGIGADGLQEAYEKRGVNYLYWGSIRSKTFAEGIRRLARRNREDLVIVVQSYARLGSWLIHSAERALRQLSLDYSDILLLGLHNRPPSGRFMEAALRLREKGRVRFLAVSCHRRPTFRRYLTDGMFDVLMFRYNAAHRGAEEEIIPYLEVPGRPGTVAYTATRWGKLINPKKTPPGETTPRTRDCYRFVLSQPQVDVCLAGPANVEQLREGLAALEEGPMSSEEMAWMRRIGDYIHGTQ